MAPSGARAMTTASGLRDRLLELSQQTRLPRGVPVYSRLWPELAGCQAAAKPALEHRDPFGCPTRSPMVGARSIRAVVARSAEPARTAAKSGIGARNAPLSPANHPRLQDGCGRSTTASPRHGLTNAATSGLRAM